MRNGSIRRWFAARSCLALGALALAALAWLGIAHYAKHNNDSPNRPLRARVIVDFNRDLRISRNDAVYFRAIGEIDAQAPGAEYQDTVLRKKLLQALTIVPDRQSARYVLQIRDDVTANPAIRDDDGRPSRSYVMFSLGMASDLQNAAWWQNTTFYFFETSGRDALFDAAFDMWLKRAVAESK